MKKVNIYIYTDITGGAREKGYYAYLLEVQTPKGPATKGKIRMVENYTSNRAQMAAVAEAMKRVKEPCEITLYTDAAYLQSGLEHGWISKWEANGWKKKDGKEVANKTEWIQLKGLLSCHDFHFVTNKRHSYYKWMCSEVAQRKKKDEKTLKTLRDTTF